VSCYGTCIFWEAGCQNHGGRAVIFGDAASEEQGLETSQIVCMSIGSLAAQT
jgi:hypothetical protein